LLKKLVVLLIVVLSQILAPAVAWAQATPAADTEANNAVVRELYDIFNTGDLSGFDAIVAADVVDHDAAPGQATGIEGFKQAFGGYIAGFPGINVTIDDLIAEGDLIAARTTAFGTHTGTFAGLPPTGTSVAIPAIAIYRIADGKIVETWHIEDLVALMAQLGVMPGGPPAATPMPAASPSADVEVDAATLAANKELIGSTTFDAVQTLDVATLDQLFAPDFVNHQPAPGFPPTWEGLRSTLLAFRQPFPDEIRTQNLLFAEGDLVVQHLTLRGTHTGEAYGVPATGRQVEYDGINIWRIENGKIVELWSAYEVFSILVQIGAIPGGAPGTPEATPAATTGFS
jgi:hypothetical protein